MQKHEDRFILYSIASAFLLVAGFVFSFSYNKLAWYEAGLMASIKTVFVSAEVDQSSFRVIEPGYISGHVFEMHNKTPLGLGEVDVYLYDEDTIGDLIPRFQTKTNSDGYYSFDAVPLGTYSIQIQTPSPLFETISKPHAFIQEIPYSSHMYQVSLSVPGGVHADFDFYVQ